LWCDKHLLPHRLYSHPPYHNPAIAPATDTAELPPPKFAANRSFPATSQIRALSPFVKCRVLSNVILETCSLLIRVQQFSSWLYTHPQQKCRLYATEECSRSTTSHPEFLKKPNTISYLYLGLEDIFSSRLVNTLSEGMCDPEDQMDVGFEV
jgi:hypothetical protein